MARTPAGRLARLLAWQIAILPVLACNSNLPVVTAREETDPVASKGDAADDAVIAVNRSAPERSVILATDKRAGIHVYALSGRELQFVPLGEANNIDLREGFPFAAGPAPIVAVSNRSRNAVTLFRFDERPARLVPEPVGFIDAEIELPEEIYGICLYRPEEDVFHVGATSTGGRFLQWALSTREDGTVAGNRVRSLDLGSKVEGCAFDDGLRRLYVGEEAAGLWRLPADPDTDGDGAPVLVHRTWPWGKLRADVEGVEIYARPDGSGYIIVSSQGDDSFHLYRRKGENEYVGRFRVGPSPDGRIDGVSQTDGLGVTSANLGSDWSAGLLVVQDGENTDPAEKQNFKLVSWADVERALGL